MKYAKYLPELNRRETWDELVTRNKKMHQKRYPKLKEQIEEDIKSKYLKRIDHLVGANNELLHKLERCEKERSGYASLADNILMGKDE